MFKTLMDYRPDLSVVNRQGLNPFTLAAKLARIEVKNTIKFKINII